MSGHHGLRQRYYVPFPGYWQAVCLCDETTSAFTEADLLEAFGWHLEAHQEPEVTWETSPEVGGLQQACLIAGAEPELPL